MARRVNTKFVVVLGTAMFVGAGVTVGVVGRSMWKNRDPKSLVKLGDDALGRGDLKTGIMYYERAAVTSSASHLEGTDALYTKLGDLSMQLSSQTTNPVDSGRYYIAAQGAWKRALTENASYVPARQRLLEEQYKIATFESRAERWTELEDTARKMTQQDKTYGKAFTYLAAARFALLQVASTMSLDAKQAKSVDDDIDNALKADPTSAQPTILRASLRQLQATKMPPSSAKEAKKLLEGSVGELKAYLGKHPNDPDVAIALASLYWGLKQQDEGIKTLEAAVAAQPGHVRVSWLLAQCEIELRSPDKAEKVLKALTAAAPEDPEGYMALAKFYQAARKPREAIEALNKVIEHPQGGGGIAAVLNVRREVDATYNISWMYMDIVEDCRRNGKTDDAKEALDQATAFATKLRAAPSLKASQDMLEGRLHLLNGDVREAITALQRADAVFGKQSPSSPQWMQAKAVLSQAFEMNTEWGNALRYLDEMLSAFPKSPSVTLQKARVLCRVAKWKEALELVGPYADAPAEAGLQAELQQQARSVQVEAYRGLNMLDKADAVAQKIGTPAAIEGIIRSRISEGDLQAALQELDKALEGSPANEERLLVMSVVVNLRLEHKDEAKALLGKALAKYPTNTQLQVMQALLSKPDGDPVQTQAAALEVIPDPFTRHMALAQLYRQVRNRDKQLEELEQAEKSLEDSPTAAQSREMISQVSDQIFSLNLAWADEARTQSAAAKARADGTSDGEKKSKAAKEKEELDKSYKKYWEQAELYAQRAERLNLDGADGKLYRGRLEFSKGGDSRKVGIQTLEQAVAARPTNSASRTVLGQAYYMERGPSNGNADKALEQFREAIQQKPDNGIALRFAMDLLIAKGTTQSLNEARGYLKQAFAFTPRDPQLQRLADQLMDPAESIRKREEARKVRPDDLENLRSLAILYVGQGQPLKAVELFKIIYQKYPEDLDLANTIAHLLHEGHKDNDALTMYEHFIGSDDADTRFKAMLLFGDMYRALNRPEQAVATYRSAIAKQPAGTDDAQRRLADLYFDMEAMKEAEEIYREIYDQAKVKDIRVLRRLVESIIRQGKFADADVLINKLLAQQPEDADGWILRGFSLLRQNNMQGAIECFNHVLKNNPTQLDALHYRAFALFTSNGDLDQAVKDLLTIRERDDKRINSRLLLAKVYRANRKFAESATEYEDVIKLAPDVPAYRIEYAQFLLSVADALQRLNLENQSEFAMTVRVVRPVERLQNLLRDSSGRFPEQPVWLILEGNFLSLRGQLSDGQQKYLEAFKLSGENPTVASTYLNSLLSTKAYEEVISLVSRLASKDPQYGDYFVKRGMAYAALGKKQEALGDFVQAMGLAGKNLELNLSVVRQAGKSLPAETLSYLGEKIKADTGDVAARLGLGDVLLSNGRGAEAVPVIAPLIADSKAPYYKLALRMNAMAKYMAKDMEGAYQAYSELLKLTPNDLEVLNNISFLLAEDMNRPKEGLKYAEDAVKILKTSNVELSFVNNGNVYDTYGWVKFLAGDSGGAITELRRALQIEPSPIAYYHLARVLSKSHPADIPGARRALSEGIQLANQTKDPALGQLETLKKEIGAE